MTRVLVTGGTGVLGSELVRQLRDVGYIVRVMSRRPQPTSIPDHTEWAQADLRTGEGLADSVRDVQAICHSATSSFKQSELVDVQGTRRVLDVARQANVTHFIYISIVGIDKVSYTYYRNKLAAEKLIVESGVPYTIMRATQFHNLIDLALRYIAKSPIMPLPTDFQFQTVEVSEVAAQLAAYVDAEPAGRVQDMGGPQVLRLGDMARVWLKARGMKRLILPLPLWGKTAAGFRGGDNTCCDCRKGTFTWAAWANRTYSKGAK